MNTTQKIEILFRLGKILNHLSENKDWENYDLGINQDEYNALKELVNTVHIYNGWFTPKTVQMALKGVSEWLSKDSLETFVKSYSITDKAPKNIALIMAGNIPLVGFHDLLCTFLAGHRGIIKLSSDDNKLIPALIKTMGLFDEEIHEWMKVEEGKLENFQAVIATGSDNSSDYFQDYFGKYPHIIRKHRTSVAVITGDETETELTALGHDVFDFHGLGCRNVSKLFIPKSFKLDRFFEAIYNFNPIIHHNKYANNYDYNKAVYLMNQVPILDNNFLMLKEDESMHSPLGVLLYEYYADSKELKEKILGLSDKLQVIVGKGYVDFGSAQYPKISDYADKVDTMNFLTSL